MFTFDVEKWTPRFLMDDRNGRAMARAIEAGVQAMNDTVEEALSCCRDIDAMPLWRLDELAWEYNCLYDYSAGIEAKREWIRNATPYYSQYGTTQAIVKYLTGVFDSAAVQEAADYGGDPFHFRVIVTGEWSPAADSWARRAIEETKNVRSVLDNILFNAGSAEAALYVSATVCGAEVADAVTAT